MVNLTVTETDKAIGEFKVEVSGCDPSLLYVLMLYDESNPGWYAAATFYSGSAGFWNKTLTFPDRQTTMRAGINQNDVGASNVVTFQVDSISSGRKALLSVTELSKEEGRYQFDVSEGEPNVRYDFWLREPGVVNPIYNDEWFISGEFYTNPEGAYTYIVQWQERTAQMEVYVQSSASGLQSNTVTFYVDSTFREEPTPPPSTSESKPAVLLAGFPTIVYCLWLLREALVPEYVHKLLHPLI